MYGFVIAIMLCKGDNCDLIRADPDVYYQSYEQCDTARSASAAVLQAMADKRAAPDRTPRIICMHPIETIVEVEEPHDVLETAIVHKEPSASSQYSRPRREGEAHSGDRLGSWDGLGAGDTAGRQKRLCFC